MIEITLIENIFITGALTGAVYALYALGFTLIYGVAGVVNMAHGALYMLGAYAFFVFGPNGPFGLDIYSSLVLAAIFVGVIGSIVYRLTIHQIIKDMLAVLVVTIGIALLFVNVITIGFRTLLGSTDQALPSFTREFHTILGVGVPDSSILVAVVSLGLFALVWGFITKFKIGRAMKATAQDREAAMLMGINTTRLFILTMAISASLAATAGILYISSTSGTARPGIWVEPLVLSFAIVVLGGLGSIKGTLIGAFIIGYVHSAVILTLSGGASLAGAFSLGVMVLVLVLRPRGLFGKRVELE